MFLNVNQRVYELSFFFFISSKVVVELSCEFIIVQNFDIF